MSDRDAHGQEVEGLERKLTEAEREAAAANVSFSTALASLQCLCGDYHLTIQLLFSGSACHICQLV